MRVLCETKLEQYIGDEWPKYFACRPCVGDYVESANGNRLRVVSVTHVAGRTIDGGPCGALILELGK